MNKAQFSAPSLGSDACSTEKRKRTPYECSLIERERERERVTPLNLATIRNKFHKIHHHDRINTAHACWYTHQRTSRQTRDPLLQKTVTNPNNVIQNKDASRTYSVANFRGKRVSRKEIRHFFRQIRHGHVGWIAGWCLKRGEKNRRGINGWWWVSSRMEGLFIVSSHGMIRILPVCEKTGQNTKSEWLKFAVCSLNCRNLERKKKLPWIQKISWWCLRIFGEMPRSSNEFFRTHIRADQISQRDLLEFYVESYLE